MASALATPHTATRPSSLSSSFGLSSSLSFMFMLLGESELVRVSPRWGCDPVDRFWFRFFLGETVVVFIWLSQCIPFVGLILSGAEGTEGTTESEGLRVRRPPLARPGRLHLV